ncbi:MAG: hypothetical protein Q8K70_12235 [Bacteroidota bacterium]|nr:hypothetical protein [Bacteroidota bacterium]
MRSILLNSKEDSIAADYLNINGLYFEFNPIIDHKDGFDKCGIANYKINEQTHFLKDSMQFFCNKTLIYNNDTVKAFNNLINTPFTETFDDRNLIKLNHIQSNNIQANYSFHISSKSSDHKTHKDSCIVFIK